MIRYLLLTGVAVCVMATSNLFACEPGQTCSSEVKAKPVLISKHERKQEKLENWKTKRLQKCGQDQACTQRVERQYGKKSTQLQKHEAKRKAAAVHHHKEMKGTPDADMNNPHSGEEHESEHPGKDVK